MTAKVRIAATTHDLINLLSMAEGTHFTGVIAGPASDGDGWSEVYEFVNGKAVDHTQLDLRDPRAAEGMLAEIAQDLDDESALCQPDFDSPGESWHRGRHP